MRPIFILLLCSVLSILAVKYSNNSMSSGVPMVTPETAASVL